MLRCVHSKSFMMGPGVQRPYHVGVGISYADGPGMTIIEFRVKVREDLDGESLDALGEHLKDVLYDDQDFENSPLVDVTYEVRDDYQD